MLGAIIGDIVGSVYEFNNIKTKDFDLYNKDATFTDDTILTMACLDWCLNSKDHSREDASKYIKQYAKKYPSTYGANFRKWVYSDKTDGYGSYGNGAAMRISPIANLFHNRGIMYELTSNFTKTTHNSYEALFGAKTISHLIMMANDGCSKEQLKEYSISYYPEIENMNYQNLVDYYRFNETCQGTVPQAIYCFLISKDFEDCLRTSISIGGDSDTLACISCSIAEAYYKDIPQKLKDYALSKLPKEFIYLLKKAEK